MRSLVIRLGTVGTCALITAFSAVAGILVTLILNQLVSDNPITARLIYIPLIGACIIAPMASYYAIKLLRELIDAEEENARVVQELSETLSTVNQLQGLLPICAWCKKIRDQDGSWQKLETYISDNSEAEFSHAICLECKQADHWDNVPENNVPENISGSNET